MNRQNTALGKQTDMLKGLYKSQTNDFKLL